MHNNTFIVYLLASQYDMYAVCVLRIYIYMKRVDRTDTL